MWPKVPVCQSKIALRRDLSEIVCNRNKRVIHRKPFVWWRSLPICPHIPALKGGSALHPRSEAQIVQVFRAEMVLFGGLFG